nr:MgtC/SapB family protein [uncultured Agathobaculum sp.]
MDDILSYLRQLNIVSLLFRMVLAMIAGGVLGLERMHKRRPAGSRTYMLVSVGAALAMLLGQYELAMVNGPWAEVAEQIGQRIDVSRFGAQVINGIGFIGAGTILVTGRQQVKGLTTSAGLWASACMGLAIGAGFYECVLLGVLLIFLAMRVLPMVEEMLVERAPIINVYVEFESLDNLGTIISRIKQQHAQVLDVDIEHERTGRAQNPSAVFCLRLENRLPHTRILIAIAGLDCVCAIEEF